MTVNPGPNYFGFRRQDPTNPASGLDLIANGNTVESFGGVAGITSSGATSGALLAGRGTSASPVTASVAGKFISQYFSSSVTSGSVEGVYTRTYLTGAGADINAFRAFATVTDVAAGSAARGAHISLSWGTSGTVTGLGTALEATLHVPTTAGMTGTVSAIKAAINSDAATSDPVGSRISFIQIVNQGDATGGADVDDDAACLDFDGFTVGSGNMIEASTTESNYAYSVRCKLPDGTPVYMMLASAAG